MSAGDVHSILYRGTDPLNAQFKPSYDPSKKTTRLRAGKGPIAPVADDDRGLKTAPESSAASRRLQRLKARTPIEGGTRRPAEAVVIVAATSATIRDEGEVPGGGGDTEAPAVVGGGDMLREEAIRLRKLEEQQLEEIEMEEGEEDDDIIDEDDASTAHASIVYKPKFITKSERNSTKRKELDELKEKLREAQELDRLEERVNESKSLVKDLSIVEEVPTRVRFSNLDDEEMPDDNDDLHAEEEFEKWKIRELTRLKRDKEEEAEREIFLKEVERRRNMTDEERVKDDERLDKLLPQKEDKQKYRFLQKYHHKGAFFQDKAQTGEEPLYLRDFGAPTNDDLVDRSALPKPMQLRRDKFGKVGQTKYTHLTDIDTTDRTSGWFKKTNDAKEQPPAKRARGN
eukprot:GHVO01017449.1.p2 GENE.GHVO01017449.1~~GHVO01017449.1.p2  ORF type:complete len:410 (+),score=119.40 GHVO01017449.1:31-1230(+)